VLSLCHVASSMDRGYAVSVSQVAARYIRRCVMPLHSYWLLVNPRYVTCVRAV
jgi:hypothetical protein